MKVPGLFRNKSKYRNRKVEVDGLTFDSMAESKRWCELSILLNTFKISQLERQVVYELAPAVRLSGEKRLKPALRYVADFRYFDGAKGHFVVEDTKGRDTAVSRIKRHLMKSVHGIDVVLS